MDLETPRLKLEPFNNSHYAGLRIMDGDSGVMRYITGGVVKTPEETREGIRRVQARWNKYKFSWWAIKEKASGVRHASSTWQTWMAHHLRSAGVSSRNTMVKAMQQRQPKRSLKTRQNG